MKSATHFLRLLAIGVWLVEGLFSASAIAGPATYDKETKSFRFRYTFTNVAGSPQDLGAVVKPSAEEEGKVKELVAAVSQILSQATEGRAKIGRLDYVDNAKDADLIISLSPRPASAGVSNLHTIEGNPGHLVLYYQTLLPSIRQDVINTSVHELGHYIFGLADEYNYNNFPGGCPPDPSLRSPGCLMDNFNTSARNWMGRFCRDGEHNKTSTQPESCQSIVDKFFKDRGVTDKDPAAVAAAGSGSGKETVISSTLGKVRAEIEKKTAASGGASGSIVSGLVGFARKTLSSLIKEYNENNPNKVLFNSGQLGKAVDLIVKASTALPTTKPLGLTEEVFEIIKTEAKRLGQEASTLKTPSARFAKVRSGLQAVLKTLASQSQFAPENFDKNEQKTLIERLARAESRTDEEKALDQLNSMSEVQLEYSQKVARWIVTILDEMEAPGTRSRLNELNLMEDRLKMFSIPGRTAQGFGQRRSRFITPDPIVEEATEVLTQGGVFSYNDVRTRGFQHFSRLINRERIELVTPRFDQGGGVPLAVRIDRPLEPKAGNELEILRQQNNTNLVAFLNETFNQLERNRLENITVLVPPGGFPEDLRSYLQVMKIKLGDDYDVRLDIVLVGSATILPELRDLCLRSHGSVLTVTDLDEVGAIAQRLKDEQSSGAWVIVPQVSTIPQVVQASVPSVAGNPGDSGTPDLGTQIKVRFEIVKKMIEEAKSFLGPPEPQGNQALSLPEAVKSQLENASLNLQNFESLLNNLRAAEAAAGDSRKCREERIAGNYRVLRLIALTRDSLKSLEGSINLASNMTNIDDSKEADPLVKLSKLAKGYFNPEEKIAGLDFDQLKNDAAEEKEKQFIESLKNEKISKLERLRRFLRLHEKWLEANLDDTHDDVPIYKRIDRAKVDIFRKQIESAQVLRATGHPFAETIDKVPNSVRLARFYVESGGKLGDFNFELVVGLSRALPQIPNKKTGRLETHPPEIELYSDNGVIAADSHNMTLEKGTTDPGTMLVYRAQDPFRLSEGWYTPVLRFEPEVLNEIRSPNEINFTFSVASLRPNIQLIASLKQPDTTDTHGTLRSGEQVAVVEVLVSAGSPVRGAQVVGFFQKITHGGAEISTQELRFEDQGQVILLDKSNNPTVKDTLKDDGIYTAKIPIGDVKEGTEFRVFIQADTTDGKAQFIALDDPNRFKPEADQDQPLAAAKTKAKKSTLTRTLEDFKARGEKDQKKAEGEAPKFQRATSLHFRVEP